MDPVMEATCPPVLIVSDALGYFVKRLVETAREYETILLIYEDDFGDQLLGAWAELDRLHLKTRPIGTILDGIAVHVFGLQDFPPGTVLEIHLKECSQAEGKEAARWRAAYRSLLNEVCQVSVRIYSQESGHILLQ